MRLPHMQLEMIVAAVTAGVLILAAPRLRRSWLVEKRARLAKGAAEDQEAQSDDDQPAYRSLTEQSVLVRRPTIKLESLPLDAGPARLSCAFYFDFEAACSRTRPAHDLGAAQLAEYLQATHNVGAALDGLHEYVVATLSALQVANQHRSIMAADVLMGNDKDCLGWIQKYREPAADGETRGRRRTRRRPAKPS